jgi:hypothetical protein
MPGLDSHIFALALTLFLLIGSANLTLEQLINLLTLLKKLKATMEAEYSLEKGKLEVRSRGEPDSHANATPPLDAPVTSPPAEHWKTDHGNQ